MSNDFAFTQHLVENTLYYCVYDSEFLRLTRSVLSIEYLPGELVQELFKILYRYFDERKDRSAPGRDSFLHEVEERISTGKVKKELSDSLRRLASQILEIEPANRDYILSKVDKFSRRRYYESSAIDLSLKAKRFDLDGAKQIAVQTARFGIGDDIDLGMDFFSKDSFRNRGIIYETKSDFLMPIGIEPFDKKGGFLQRKTFILIMAPEKRGKTWSGVHFGKVGLMQGLQILHVLQGDVTENKLAERYEQSFAGVGAAFKADDWEHQTPVLREEKGKLKPRFIDLKPGTVKDRQKVGLHLKAIEAYGGKLIIKKFPRGTCSMSKLEQFIDNLHVIYGFVPDVIINDYPDIMKLSGSDYRNSIDDIYQKHDALADMRNCLVIGFSQVTKKAYASENITMADFAEDKRKAAHCHEAFAICRTPEEEENGIARLVWVIDRYFGLERSVACIIQDYHIGQFCKKAYSLKDLDLGDEEQEE